MIEAPLDLTYLDFNMQCVVYSLFLRVVRESWKTEINLFTLIKQKNAFPELISIYP